MVCVTGDVHQRSYRGTDTSFSPFSEVELAAKYANIAARYGIRITLFFTGKACLEEPSAVKRIAAMPHCEIGGTRLQPFETLGPGSIRNYWGLRGAGRPTKGAILQRPLRVFS
jgi:hypothetical protein